MSNKNETSVFKEDVSKITQKHEDMLELLVEEIKALKTVVNENRELIHENKKMREDLSNLKKNLEKNVKTRCADHQGNGKFTKKCQFPFSWKGKLFSSCTKYDHNSLWCSTKTAKNNKHVEGEWGECAPPKNSNCY